MKTALSLLSLGVILSFSACALSPSPNPESNASKQALQEKIQQEASSYYEEEGHTGTTPSERNILKAKISIARDKTTSPEFLALLAHDENQNVALFTAKNPNTPIKNLEEFFASDDVSVLNYLATNTALPAYMLDTLSRHEHPDVRQAAGYNPSNSVKNLKLLAEDQSSIVQNHVARNPKLPEEVMLHMAMHSQIGTLEVLLKREDQKLPESVLQALKSHPHSSLAQKAAAYENE